MNRILSWVGVLAFAVLADASAVRAQTFRGGGQEATELFPLPAGLSVFELEHQGTGGFAVRLLDEQGRVVEELANASGAFRGSRAVRIVEEGRYLLDVSASGPWSVRRRDDAAPAPASAAAPVLPDTASPTYKAAVAAADQVSTGGWLARGLIGGTLAGPIGAGIVVGMAARSGVADSAAEASGVAAQGPGYAAAFTARVREQRKKRAFVGGMLGSGIFLAGLIYAIDVAQGGEGGAPGAPPGGGAQFVIVTR